MAWAVGFAEHNCILINFDRDGDHIDGIPSWEW